MSRLTRVVSTPLASRCTWCRRRLLGDANWHWHPYIWTLAALGSCASAALSLSAIYSSSRGTGHLENPRLSHQNQVGPSPNHNQPQLNPLPDALDRPSVPLDPLEQKTEVVIKAVKTSKMVPLCRHTQVVFRLHIGGLPRLGFRVGGCGDIFVTVVTFELKKCRHSRG